MVVPKCSPLQCNPRSPTRVSCVNTGSKFKSMVSAAAVASTGPAPAPRGFSGLVSALMGQQRAQAGAFNPAAASGAHPAGGVFNAAANLLRQRAAESASGKPTGTSHTTQTVDHAQPGDSKQTQVGSPRVTTSGDQPVHPLSVLESRLSTGPVTMLELPLSPRPRQSETQTAFGGLAGVLLGARSPKTGQHSKPASGLTRSVVQGPAIAGKLGSDGAAVVESDRYKAFVQDIYDDRQRRLQSEAQMESLERTGLMRDQPAFLPASRAMTASPKAATILGSPSGGAGRAAHEVAEYGDRIMYPSAPASAAASFPQQPHAPTVSVNGASAPAQHMQPTTVPISIPISVSVSQPQQAVQYSSASMPHQQQQQQQQQQPSTAQLIGTLVPHIVDAIFSQINHSYSASVPQATPAPAVAAPTVSASSTSASAPSAQLTRALDSVQRMPMSSDKPANRSITGSAATASPASKRPNITLTRVQPVTSGMGTKRAEPIRADAETVAAATQICLLYTSPSPRD